MLHRCIEGERVGVDGGEVVDVDRRHDVSPGGTPAPGPFGTPPGGFWYGEGGWPSTICIQPTAATPTETA